MIIIINMIMIITLVHDDDDDHHDDDDDDDDGQSSVTMIIIRGVSAALENEQVVRYGAEPAGDRRGDVGHPGVASAGVGAAAPL